MWSPRNHTHVVAGMGAMVRLCLSSPYSQSLFRSLRLLFDWDSMTNTVQRHAARPLKVTCHSAVCAVLVHKEKMSTPGKVGCFERLLASWEHMTVKPLKDTVGNTNGHWSISASWESARTLYSALTTSRFLEEKQQKQVCGIKPYQQPCLGCFLNQSSTT